MRGRSSRQPVWLPAGLKRSLPFRRVLAALGGVVLVSACRDQSVASADIEIAAPVAGERITFPAGSMSAIALKPGVQRHIASILNITERLEYGDYAWNDSNVPPGESWVLVDLKAQTISLFRGPHEIGTAVTLYGVDEKPTPTGSFKILAKLKDHQSSIYDAEMPYTLRLTGDGIAIHGSDVREGVGTHGCLGIPLEFAGRLFDQLKVGDEVMILKDAEAHLKAPVIVRAADAT